MFSHAMGKWGLLETGLGFLLLVGFSTESQ
jgi:hypothetical protein